jgi:hypothetical protein
MENVCSGGVPRRYLAPNGRSSCWSYAGTTQAFAARPDNGNLTPGHGRDTDRGRANIPFRQITDSFVSTEASPLTMPPRIHTQEQQATRPRERVSETGESAIPPDIVPKTQRIASPDRISPLWHYLRAQRPSLPATGADKNLRQQSRQTQQRTG